jgi:hypothetical protein
MRVLGAIEFAPGNTIVDRIKHVSGIVFTEEDDQRHQFTWRTIQTWYSRYQKDGITSMHPRCRSDKGLTRKVQPELLAEVIDQVRPQFHGNPDNITAVYRACIERGLLARDRVAPNTFRRHVKQYELLKPDLQSDHPRRLAFAKAHANEMWQAFTPDALALIVRSSEGYLRRARNLCLGSLVEAVRDHTRTVDLKQVNRVLLQPHWREREAA